MSDETRTPGELLEAGVERLPCGLPLLPGRDAFKQRLQHYRSCLHPYCVERLRFTRATMQQLSDDIRQQKEAHRGKP